MRSRRNNNNTNNINTVVGDKRSLDSVDDADSVKQNQNKCRKNNNEGKEYY